MLSPILKGDLTMSCNAKSPYAKSCVRVYNNAAQAFVADPASIIALQGDVVVDSGCSLDLNASSVQIVKSGLYHISADVTFTPTAAGEVAVQLYKDGIAMPCAISTEEVVADVVYTTHIETDILVSVCCINQPSISVRIGGVAGTVNHICAGVLKLA